MRRFIDFAVRLIRAGERAYERKWSFLSLFAVVFLVSVIVLGTSDLLPEVSYANKSKTTNTVTQPQIAAELPTRIEIPKINLSAAVVNPTITTVAVLDKELLRGVVRYPTSALLGETGNVVLFGHSSYLPVVGNQAYKTFNEIQKLVVGDSITVYSSGTAYTYRVRSVVKESANDGVIELSVTGRVLTLVTCSSFGAKEDRFVVTADLYE